MNTIILIVLSFLLGMWLPKKVRNIELSENTINGLCVFVCIIFIFTVGFGFFSFLFSYNQSPYDSYNSCNHQTRLNNIDPFHKLGCYLSEIVE